MPRNGTARRGHHPGIALAIILTCQLMVILDGTIVNVAIPQIRQELHFSTTGLSWIGNAFALAFGGLLLLGGRVGDVLGRRRVFSWGIGAFTAASVLGGFAHSPSVLLLARVLQGSAAAFASSAALALLISNFAEGPARTKAIASYATVSSIGGSVGLVFGAAIVQVSSWRWAFFVNIPIGILIVVLVPHYLHETERHPGRFDLIGALSSTLGVSSLVFGLIRAAEHGWGDPICLLSVGLATLSITTFIRQEMRVEQPIMPLHLFASKERSASYAARAFIIASLFGSFFFLSQYFQEVLGYSPIQNGLAILPNTAAFFFSAKVGAHFLPKWGTRRTALTGLPVTALGLLLLTQIGPHSSYLTHIGIPMLLLGSGIGFPMIALTLAGMSGIAPKDSGAASGMLNVVQQVGGALGLSILVTVFGVASRHTTAHPMRGLTAIDQQHAVFVHGVRAAFWGGSVFAIASIVIVALFIKPGRPESVDVDLVEEPALIFEL